MRRTKPVWSQTKPRLKVCPCFCACLCQTDGDKVTMRWEKGCVWVCACVYFRIDVCVCTSVVIVFNYRLHMRAFNVQSV